VLVLVVAMITIVIVTEINQMNVGAVGTSTCATHLGLPPLP
jgi:hypothetical protein